MQCPASIRARPHGSWRPLRSRQPCPRSMPAGSRACLSKIRYAPAAVVDLLLHTQAQASMPVQRLLAQLTMPPVERQQPPGWVPLAACCRCSMLRDHI